MNVTVEPKLLQWAMERASLNQEELAKKLPRKQVDQIKEWLKTGHLPLKALEAIAEKTRVALGYLFLKEPPEEPLPIPDYRTVGGEGVRRASPELIDTLNLHSQRQEWYREYLEDIGVEPLEFLGRFTAKSNPNEVAANIREIIGWTVQVRVAAQSVDLVVGKFATAIEKAGILVMRNGIVGNNSHRPLDPKEFRGFAMFDDLAPLIFVNAADAKVAQMFTLAHELAHIWIGKSALVDVRINTNKPLERFCNRVAAEVLVPSEEFNDDWKELDEDGKELQRLSHKYRVSRFVILIRARESGLISQEVYDDKEVAERNRDFSTSTKSSGGGDFYATQRSRLGRKFAPAVINSAKVGKTLIRDAYNLLGVKKVETFNKLAGFLEESR